MLNLPDFTNMKIKPLVFGENDLKRDGYIFYRISATNSMDPLRSGVSISNEWNKSPGDVSLFGLYFSCLGKVKDLRDIDVKPIGNEGMVEIELRNLQGTIEDLVTKGRYAVITAIKIDRENFHLFRDRIGEIESLGSGRDRHIPHIRSSYEEIKGIAAMINVQGIPQTALKALEDDLKLLIYDRENPPHEVEFKPYKEIAREMEVSAEIRREILRS